MTDDSVTIGVQVNGSSIGGDVVGRDKVVNNIQTIYQRALTAAEESAQSRSLEAQILAHGVSVFAQQLLARAQAGPDTGNGNPYKGLLSYRLSDAPLFFGRDESIRDLTQQLATAPLTILHAESGAGKTSLLQAGLSPRLISDGHLPLYLRPYNADPALVIKRAFLSDPSQAPLLATAPLRDFLRQVSGVLGTLTTLYIYLDQFEEFFTFLDEPARVDFVRELAECLDDESLNVRWVLALRTEGFGNLANFRPRIKNPFENDYRLNRLTPSEARMAIEEPVGRRGLTFETGLVDLIVAELGKTEIAPPQIQLVCSALFDELEDRQTSITLALYEREGRAAGILRGHLERVLSRDLSRDQRAAARRLLESLITSEQQRVLRTQADLVAELAGRGITPQTLATIIDQLVDSRLLRVEETDTGLAYELAHDYLLQEIKLDPEVQARKAAQELLEQEVRAYRRFKTLLTTERLAVIEPYQTELSLTAEAEALLSESRAEVEREGREEAARRQRELDEAHKLADSEKRRAEEQALATSNLRRRNRLITGVGFVALLAAVIAFWFATQASQSAREAQTANTQAANNLSTAQYASTLSADNLSLAQTQGTKVAEQRDEAEQQARLARAGQLAAQAREVLAEYPNRSLLLAAEALRLNQAIGQPGIPAAEQILRDALKQVSGRNLPLTEAVKNVAFSPDGRWLLTIAGENKAESIQLRKVTTGTVSTESFNLPKAGGPVAFSPTSRWLVTGSSQNDNKVYLWRMTTSGAAVEPIELNGPAIPPTYYDAYVLSFTFSPDGRWLAIGDHQGAVFVWRVAEDGVDSKPITLVPPRSDFDSTPLAFLPDSSGLITYDSSYTFWNLNVTEDGVSSAPFLPLDDLASLNEDVTIMLYSPDGRWFLLRTVSKSDVATLRLWPIQADGSFGNESVTTSDQTYGWSEVAFSPDSRWVLTQDYYQTTILLWDLHTSDPLSKSAELSDGQEQGINMNWAFSPDGRSLVTTRADGALQLWDLENNQAVATLGGQDGGSRVPVFGPNCLGRDWDEQCVWLLAAVGADGSIRLWDTSLQDRYGSPTVSINSNIVDPITFSPDGRWLESRGANDEVVLWDLNADSPSQVFYQLAETMPSGVFSPSGRWLVANSWNAITVPDGSALVWDLWADNPAKTGRVLKDSTAPSIMSPDARPLNLFSPDERWLANTSFSDGSIRLWDLNQPDLQPIQLANTAEPVTFSPDGQWLVTGSNLNQLQIWHIQVKPIAVVANLTLDCLMSTPEKLAISADSHWLIASDQAGFCLWDLEAQDVPGSRQTYYTEAPIQFLRFSPDGQWLVAETFDGLDNRGLLWDMGGPASLEVPLKMNQSNTCNYGPRDSDELMVFSSDGHWLATHSSEADNLVCLWDLQAPDPTQRPYRLSGLASGASSFAFSPLSHWLLTSSSGTDSRLWRLTATDPSQNPIALTGSSIGAQALFSPDETWLSISTSRVSATSDIYLWNLTRPDYLNEPVLLRNVYGGLSFSANGRWLVLVDLRTLYFYPLQYGDLIAQACEVAGRNFRLLEWTQYFVNEPYRSTCEQWPAGQ